MGMQERAQRFAEQEHNNQQQGKSQVLSEFRPSRWGIVDQQLVEVLGTQETPGMSLTALCSDPITGHTAPVSLREARIFATPGQALQILALERGPAAPSSYGSQSRYPTSPIGG